ncbi:MAG: hypothetical protein SGJ01_10290 [Gemmatimonadota bacterium]|nr:hypothetical protein [Gemmatimonadota bacterium]MDZ4863821.1 hypothetical protein [Gemmatimonadota bacterium]
MLDTATRYPLTTDLSIRIAAAPAYLATKWAAFDGRGRGDHVGSHDIEDIITVVAGREEILDEIERSSVRLIDFLAKRTRAFLTHPDGADAIEGALPDARFDPTLVGRVRGRLEAIGRMSVRLSRPG